MTDSPNLMLAKVSRYTYVLVYGFNFNYYNSQILIKRIMESIMINVPITVRVCFSMSLPAKQ